MQKIVFPVKNEQQELRSTHKKLIEVSCEQGEDTFLRFSSVDKEVFKLLEYKHI